MRYRITKGVVVDSITSVYLDQVVEYDVLPAVLIGRCVEIPEVIPVPSKSKSKTKSKSAK